jgi:hypothetical protein
LALRTHAAYPEVQSSLTAPGISASLQPEYLAAARFELVAHAGVDCGWLDLVFQRGEQTVMLPGILVDLAAAAKSAAAWRWPQAAAVMLSDERADAIVDIVGPWLRRLTQEPVIPLRAALTLRECPAVEIARTAADFGATPCG